MHIAAENGKNELCEFLIKNKAEVNSRDSGQCTPLHSAASFNHPETIKLLLDNGADFKAEDY